jgi:hypothetical protein
LLLGSGKAAGEEIDDSDRALGFAVAAPGLGLGFLGEKATGGGGGTL